METNLEKLREITRIQNNDGNWNYSAYMRGLANGLTLALAILEDKEPVYKDEPKKYSTDKDSEKTMRDKIIGWMHRAWN